MLGAGIVQGMSESADKTSKQSSYKQRNFRRCWTALVIASHLLARRKTMQAGAFAENLDPEIEKQLAIAESALQIVTKSLERRRKKQPSIEWKEEGSEVSDLAGIYNLLVNQQEKSCVPRLLKS